MFTLADFQETINEQLSHNRNKSLFYMSDNGNMILSPSTKTIKLLKQDPEGISGFIHSTIRDGTFQQLLKEVSTKTIKLFMEVNQYLDFNDEDHRKLQNIYGHLFERIYTVCHQNEITGHIIGQLFRSHYQNLQRFLLDSNGTEIFKKYREAPEVFVLQCAEYSPELQIKLLNINLDTIKQPVLDIGCGPQANLVRFLRANGIEAFGMDRNAETNHYLYEHFA